MSEGGGLLDDITATMKNCRFELFEFKKKDAQSGTEIPSFVVDLVPDDGETVVQPWSIGFASDWDISEDGMTVLPSDGKKTLQRNQDFGRLMKSLIEAGFDENEMGASASVFEGLKAHFTRVEIEGGKKRQGPDGKEYARSVLLVDTIVDMPGKGKGKGGKDAAVDEIEEQAKETLLDILMAEGKPLSPKDAAGKAFKALGNNKDRAKIVAMLYKDSFLNGHEEWEYDEKKKMVKVAG